jgi:hypothetical protein
MCATFHGGGCGMTTASKRNEGTDTMSTTVGYGSSVNPVPEDRQVNLGDRVRDTITGFEGIVVGRSEWLSTHGARRITCQGQTLKDGLPTDPVTFDEAQLFILKRADIVQAEQDAQYRTESRR